MASFKNLVWAAMGVLIALVFFELGLRIGGFKYESSFYESDPVLYMALRPEAEGWQAKEGEIFIRINSLGMRDRERTVAPQPGVTRIALLGDSLVAAEEVPLEKTIGQVLEVKLQSALGRPVEVLNFGVGGYTLSQEFLLLQNRVWDFRPDIVLLILSPSSVPSCDRRLVHANIPYFVLKDGDIVPDPKNRPPAASTPEARRKHALYGDLMNRFRVLQMLRKATRDGISQEIGKLRGKRRFHNETFADMWVHPPSSPAKENAWSVAEGILVEMVKDTGAHHAEFWISAVGPPIEENPNLSEREAFLKHQEVSEFSYTEERFRSFAAAHGMNYIALEPALADFVAKNRTSLRGFFNTAPNYGHWNEAGHAVAGSVLAESLLHSSRQLNAEIPASAGSPVAQTHRGQ